MNLFVDLIEFNMEIPYILVFAIIAMGVILLWISLVIWVWLDSKRYFESGIFRFFFSFLTLIFGFIGLVIYFLFRFSKLEKSETDFDSLDSIGLGVNVCSECGNVNSIENRFCSNCGFRLQKKCKNCNNYINVYDNFCSGCGAAQNKNQEIKIKENKVEKFTQLGYIKGVFSKTSAFLRSFVKNKKGKNHKRKKH